VIPWKKIRAVCFDRGNVTHNCRLGPATREKDRIAALALAQHLQHLTGQGSTPEAIQANLLTPWRASFAQRRERGHELPLEPFFIRAFPELKDKPNQLQELISILGATLIQWDQPAPDLLPLLKTLKKADLQVGIVSNTILPDRVYLHKYQSDQLTSMIDHYLFSYSQGLRKPEPEILIRACAQLGVSPQETVMIGDQEEVDLRCAREAGVYAVLYRPENTNKAHPNQADLIIQSFAELEACLT